MPESPLLIFDLTGAFAMFRKFYTNSSSLSYPFPPRTTVAGLIAGLLGYERDSYSEDLGPEQCDIAVSVRVPIRRVMQTVNYVMTEARSSVWARNTGGFDGSAGGIQTPVEWVFPALGEPRLQYRIFVHHRDPAFAERLSGTLRDGSYVYSPYLGMSECLGQVEHVAALEDWELSVKNGEIPLSTVVPSEAIAGSPRLEPGVQIVKERTAFALGADRKLLSIGDVLYERNCNPITARVGRPIFEAAYESDGQPLREFGVFLG
jgi:CRISPR-associated protein Cas5h